MNYIEVFVFLALQGKAYKPADNSGRAIGILTLIHSLCCIYIDLKNEKREV